MRNNNKLVLIAILAVSLILPTAARAAGLSIEIGDKPYYNHGARYWDGDYEMIWEPGHWDNHHHWMHGHYRRGEHRHHHDGDDHHGH